MTKKEELMDILREQCSDEVFWKWVAQWFDVDTILDQVENWESSEEDLQDDIDTLKLYMIQEKETNKQ